MNTIILKQGRERSLLRRHPWIFSGAIARLIGEPESGETVEVVSHERKFLGWGAYSPISQIRVRIWSFSRGENIDSSFFAKRIHNAVTLREALHLPQESSACRLVCAEGDGLPGVIVDRYSNFIVCQFLSAGAERWKEAIVNSLQKIIEVRGIYERSDVNVRKKEGLRPIKGPLWGEEPPGPVVIDELGVNFLVDIINGHKTGFYLDQRINRQLVRHYSYGKDVLNCFAYTGGFGLAALKGGAKSVTNVEEVAGLHDMIEKNLMMNEFSQDCCTNLRADVFKLLRQYETEGRNFDLIVLDPPKFVEAQSHLLHASRGYKDINRLAFKLLRPQGLLFTFSCSGLMKMDLFQKIVADAAIDAGSDAMIRQWLGQSPDHPVKLHIPESHYLKGLLIQTAASS